jgi:hypothetical protein
LSWPNRRTYHVHIIWPSIRTNQSSIRVPELIQSVQFCFEYTPSTTEIWLFAECQILCRVFFRALGKPRKKPSVKNIIRRRSSLPSVLFLTVGKEFLCRVSFFDTRQRALCRVSQIQHSAKSSLPSAFFPTRQRQFKNHILKQ